MDKFFIPLPNSDGRMASFRLAEADKLKFMAALVSMSNINKYIYGGYSKPPNLRAILKPTTHNLSLK